MSEQVAAEPAAPPAAAAEIDGAALANEILGPDDGGSPDPQPTPEVPGTPTPPAVETPPAAIPEADDTNKAQYWAKVTQQDQQLREYKAKAKTGEELQARFDALDRMAKEKPLEVAKALGITFEGLLDAMAGDDGATTETPADPGKGATPPELAAVVKQNAELLERVSQLENGIQTDKTESVRSRELGRIDTLVREGGEKYELIAASGEQGRVLKLAARLAAQQGINPTEDVLPALYEASAQLVEEDLLTERKERYERERNLGKLRGLYGSQPTQPAQQASAAPAPSLGGASPDVGTPRSMDDMSNEEIDAMILKEVLG